tara:strand:- start:146 stop:493 length:348 start_codon:yes stop_codon:yes gene_type:complete
LPVRCGDAIAERPRSILRVKQKRSKRKRGSLVLVHALLFPLGKISPRQHHLGFWKSSQKIWGEFWDNRASNIVVFMEEVVEALDKLFIMAIFLIPPVEKRVATFKIMEILRQSIV